MSTTPEVSDTGAPKPRPMSVVRAAWVGEHRFDAARPGGAALRVDGSGSTAQSPPDLLLSALATCAAIDVIDILAKRRTPVERLEVEVRGARREEPPRRFEHLTLEFMVDGTGIERLHAERAVQLAFDKYCSVAASLGADIQVETVVVLNGERGAAIGQVIFSPV